MKSTAFPHVRDDSPYATATPQATPTPVAKGPKIGPFNYPFAALLLGPRTHHPRQWVKRSPIQHVVL